jgi:hypothetical protein
MNMKKKKKGHVAVPFLLAFLLGIIGIGGVAYLLFNQLNGNEDVILKMNGSFSKPTEEDNTTLLFVLDEDSDPMPLTFLMARVLPAEKKIVLVSFPSNMLSVVDGKQDTLAGFYESGGIQRAKDAIATETQITVDRYIILDSETFQKICNIYAGVYYSVPAGTAGFTESTEPQYLGPAQIEKLLTYPMFDQGESQRSAVAADMLCEMLNQTDYDRIVSSMDTNFKTLINMMDTDISSIDYSDKKDALKFMFTYGSSIASFRIATGTYDEEADKFILSSTFYDGMAEFFTSEETTETTE